MGHISSDYIAFGIREVGEFCDGEGAGQIFYGGVYNWEIICGAGAFETVVSSAEADSAVRASELTGTAVPGFHMPPLRGWGRYRHGVTV